jgi:macrocin-O-methyltransferase TylF-like protien
MLVSIAAFWVVIQELLNITRPARLVEIGGDQGECTQKFCAWATARLKQLAVLRLDGDLYQSTMEALVVLYPRLMPGGYVIIDDYGAVEQCRQAVHDYRGQHGIVEEIHTIDWTGVYWQREI